MLSDRDLDDLIERTQDVHSDAMKTTTRSLDELVEVGQERRSEAQHVATLAAVKALL